MAQPVLNEGPPMTEVKNLFFKAHSSINYFADEAEASSIEGNVAFQQFNRAVESSNKHGCLFISFQNSFYLVRVSDIVSCRGPGSNDTLCFKDLKKLEIRNEALPVVPNIISLSNGEDYLSVDTVRGDSAFVVIFKLSDFINQGGACRPFCDIRCSSSVSSRISGISWNPGENMNNMVAINADDGSLFLAKIVGPNNVELNKFVQGGVRCLCWSPKGKQLVIGRMNGNLSQLKLDLSEAKQIHKPQPDYVPISILWTQTTQFLIVFQKESYIDFMQLDLPKGAPPVYTNSGDIFISESVPTKSTCYFVPFMQWNTVMTMTNSSSDIVVLVKTQNKGSELWTPGDISDNRRAAFTLDNYTRGATVYLGSEDRVVFSETESYAAMPLVFLLSQRGILSYYSLVNSDPQAASLTMKVTASIPDSIFQRVASISQLPAAPSQAPATLPTNFGFTLQAQPQPPPNLFQTPKPSTPPMAPTASVQPSLFQAPSLTQFGQPQSILKSSTPTPPNTTQQVSFQPPTFGINVPSPKPPIQTPTPKPVTPAQVQQAVQKLGESIQVQAGGDARQLGTSTLPTAKDMAGLQKAVEEKRREMTTQLQKGSSLKGLEQDDQCGFVMSEVRKFEKRLADFKNIVESSKVNLSGQISISFSNIERSVLGVLNIVEDFTSDMVSTTSAQKEEVEILKERILNHFSQLEYAKAVVERSKVPRYLEHLRSRPLDPASQQKFEEVSKLHKYVKTQISECRRYFYEQGQKKDALLERVSYSQLIYLTLSNHSKIIRRLQGELDSIKERLGLGRHINSLDEGEYLAVCEASYKNTKKTPVANDNTDEITLNDLTAGISKVKLNRDSDRPDKKPIKLSNRKLLILKKCCPQVRVVKVKADEAPWTRTPHKPTQTRPRAVTYPTKSLQESFTKMMDSAAANPPETSSTFMPGVSSEVIQSKKSEPFKMTPMPTVTSGFSSFQSPSSSGIDLSSLLGSGMPKPFAAPAPAASNVGSLLSNLLSQKPLETMSSPSPTTEPATISVSTPAATSITITPTTMTTTTPAGSGFGTFSAPDSTSKAATTGTPSLFAASFAGSVPPGSMFGSVATGGVPPTATITSTTTAGIGFGTFNASVSANKVATTSTPSIFTGSVPPGSMFGSAVTGTPTTTTTTTTGSGFGILSASDSTSKAVTTGTPSLFAASFAGSAPPGSMFGSAVTGGTGTPTTMTTTTTTGSGFGILSASNSTSKAATVTTTTGTPPLFAASFGGSVAPGNMFGSGVPTGIAPTTMTTTGIGFGTLSISDSTSKAATTSTPSLFGAQFASPVSAGSMFGSAFTGGTGTPATMTTTTTGTDSTSATTSTPPIFATSFAGSVAPGNMFGSGVSSTGVVPTTMTTTGIGFGNFSISDSTNKSTITSTPSLFGAPFASPVSTGSIFGSAVTGGVAPKTMIATATTTPGSGFGTLGASDSSATLTELAPPNTGAGGQFESPVAPAAAPATTGGGAFGSSSAFTSSAFGGTVPSGSIKGDNSGTTTAPFGVAAPTTTAPFGVVAPTTTPVGELFGAAAATTSSTTTPAAGGGLFGPGLPFSSSSTFGTSGTSIFGGGGSAFGGSQQTQVPSSQGPAGFGVFGQKSPAGNFSTAPTGAGVAQQGFGFSQPKPSGGFGSPTSAVSPVFGGGATFGSTSPFGSSFGSSTGGGSTFGTAAPAGSSIFGSSSSTNQSSSSFGALAQVGPTSVFGAAPTGGGFGAAAQQTSVFGSPQQQQQQQPSIFGGAPASPPQQQQPSLFGSPTPQAQAGKPVFGGQAFSSWR